MQIKPKNYILYLILGITVSIFPLYSDDPQVPKESIPSQSVGDQKEQSPSQQTPPTETKPVASDTNIQTIISSKRGQIEEANNQISVFYQIPSDYGKSYLDLLEKWKSKDGRIIYSEKLQLLTITDSKENIKIMEKIMEIANIPSPQIMIEAQILERIIKSDLQLGWESAWGGPVNPSTNTFFKKIDETFHPGAYLQSLAGSVGGFQGSTFSFYTTGKHRTMDIKLRTMVDRNEAVILSSPRVAVASGSKAMISSGQEVPFQQVTIAGGVATANILYKNAEIKLEVTPTALGNNFIKLIVAPEVKTVTSYQVIQGAETPVFASRRSETTITIKSGDTVHIGGLVREEDVVYERGIPLISDIPLLGNFFKRHQRDKNKTEIIFIIKPSIINKPEETIKSSIFSKPEEIIKHSIVKPPK